MTSVWLCLGGRRTTPALWLPPVRTRGFCAVSINSPVLTSIAASELQTGLKIASLLNSDKSLQVLLGPTCLVAEGVEGGCVI